MYQLFAFLKFLFRSKNQHGVHSPFVYSLVTQCFYDKGSYNSYKKLEQYRNSLLKDRRIIQVKDFGAGSRVFSSEERRVSAIAKNAGISSRRARLLNRMTQYLEVDHALELGTSLGMGTAAMAIGNEVQIITVEGCPNTTKIAQEKFEEFGLSNIDLRIGEFDKELESIISEKQYFDLFYIDGHHEKEATLRYFGKLLPLTHNDSVMIFDDIHWSQGMEEAWEQIKSHPSVKVSIDTFFWGLIFFRKEQEKEHFVIRI